MAPSFNVHAWLPSLASFLILDGNVVVVALGFWAVRRNRALWPAGLCAALYLVYLASLGRSPVMDQYYRYYVPVLGLLLWLAAQTRVPAFTAFTRQWRTLGTAAVAMGLLALNVATFMQADTQGLALDPIFTGSAIAAVGPSFEAADPALGRWLRTHSVSPRAEIALQDAGAIAYFSELPALDDMSLNDPTIIRLARTGQEPAIRRYILSRRPTYICACGALPWGLGDDPAFQRTYRLVTTPYFAYDPGYRLLLYERR